MGGRCFVMGGGAAVAVKHHALSVDHLESMTDADIELQKNIHLPAEQLLHNTVQNVFKAFDVLKALS